MTFDPFKARTTLTTPSGSYTYYRLGALEDAGLGAIDQLPYTIKVLLESVLRNCDDEVYTQDHVKALAGYKATDIVEQEIPFMPGRIILQDFTGVPAVVDLAALRSAMQRLGGDPSKVNPMVRADLVIDHSVQVDAYGNARAMTINTEREFERNKERYEFLKWGQQAFSNFTVVPPETGIVHQVNLEYLAGVVLKQDKDGESVLLPDSCLGTDSHTTMINGMGVLGWGVGGIEAEAAMLGQPAYMLIPEVVGVELTGKLPEGITATDLVLTVTALLRKHGVVGKFVEFYGPGLAELSLADRATVGNMAPEYGATCGFFPVDEKTIDYMRFSGRDEEQLKLVEAYAKANGFWRDDARKINYSSKVSLDLGSVQTSLAGPSRPQDRILIREMKDSWQLLLKDTFKHESPKKAQNVVNKDATFELVDGDIVIAAITSCTNTSNPSVMLAAGLLAQNANRLGLSVKPWVKTSLAPGSRVVTDYLNQANLTTELEKLGFFTVGYGCTTCIGNSGPLSDSIVEAVNEHDLVVTSILSGNRNFDGRISQQVRANFLASPPLAVAYAIAGTMNWDPYSEPLGKDQDGKDVMLSDIWPSNDDITEAMRKAVSVEQFKTRYANVYEGPEAWQALEAPSGDIYTWNEESTYIQEPPYFFNLKASPDPITPIKGARVLALLGQSITTDHISPAGAIAPTSPAGKFLAAKGLERRNWNSYGSRRGNDRIMTRGTFANIRIRNILAPGTEGGYTTYLGPNEAGTKAQDLLYTSDQNPQNGQVTSIYDASVKYQQHGIPLVVLAGGDYGMGSSRDWAAKGTLLLGVKAVIAESYERIHRSNLVGMGVIPLQFKDGQGIESLGLTGHEVFDIDINDDYKPLGSVSVTATKEDGTKVNFDALIRVDTAVEKQYVKDGGVLNTVLRRFLTKN